MKKMTKKEQFGWSCGYERIYGSYHAYVFSTKKGYVGLANGLYFNHITT